MFKLFKDIFSDNKKIVIQSLSGESVVNIFSEGESRLDRDIRFLKKLPNTEQIIDQKFKEGDWEIVKNVMSNRDLLPDAGVPPLPRPGAP